MKIWLPFLLIFILVFPFFGAQARYLKDLLPPSSDESLSPQLTNGDQVILSWLEPHEDEYRFRWSRLSDEIWSKPFTIVESTKTFANPADRPSILATNSRRYYAHWLHRIRPGGPAYEIILKRSVDGGSSWQEIGPIRKRNTKEKGHDGFLSSVPDGEGVRAFWIDGREDNGMETTMSLRTALIDQKIHSEHILDGNICPCCRPWAIQTDQGPIVFYRGQSKQGIRDVLYVRSTGSAWTEPRTVHDDGWKINGCPVNGPAADAKGSSIVVSWFTAAAGKPAVYAAFSQDTGKSFQKPILLSDDSLFSARGSVQAGFIPSGEVIVIWLARATKDNRLVLMSRKIDKQGRTAKAVILREFGDKQSAEFPQMIIHGNSAIIAWSDATAEKNGRFKRHVTVKKIDLLQ